MTAVLSKFWKVLNPAWLTGPIFGKELRVSSRRRRNYVLRFAHLILLTVFVAMVWLSAVQLYGRPGNALQSARMSQAGIVIIGAIIFFQFVLTQLIAVVMLSTSISDEIYHRTLGVLMTTPINSLQIVMGKLLSKLLQLILLLAITLPLLAIVRVFGGVPWDYVVSGLCITLTAALFAGSLSLYFSIHSRRAYVVILKTVFTLAFFYAFIPAIALALLRERAPESATLPVLVLLNPFAMLVIKTTSLTAPAAGAMLLCRWWWHCVIMLACTVVVLARSVQIVRRVALRQASGQLRPESKRRRKQRRQAVAGTQAEQSYGPVRRVRGPCVIWKEIRAPIIQGADRTNSIIGLGLAVAALLVTYAVCMLNRCLDDDTTQVSYVLVFVILGLVVNIVPAAASITSEKETRCWPILLATPIDDWSILLGKAVGVVRRCLPIWLLLAGHVLLFVGKGYIHPVAVVHLALVVTWLIVFLSGSGLYFSARLRRTTSAVVANIALAIVLWVALPMLFGLVDEIRRGGLLSERCVSANPFVQAVVITYGAGGTYNAGVALSQLRYEWPGRILQTAATTRILLTTWIIYVLAGVFLAWRAKRRFRKNIF
jgi:ABC-2 type transport system permease protein